MTGWLINDFKMGFHKHLRLKEYDYSDDGAYFVTICTFEKKKIISTIIKKLLTRELQDIKKRFKGVNIDFFVFMQNHCHIIFCLKNSSVPLNRIVQAFKSITTVKIKRTGFKEKVFWQRNYYEHIIRNEEELNRIRKYIRSNPKKEKINHIFN